VNHQQNLPKFLLSAKITFMNEKESKYLMLVRVLFPQGSQEFEQGKNFFFSTMKIAGFQPRCSIQSQELPSGIRAFEC